MTIPLATRGYICFGRPGGAQIFGLGPVLVQTEDLAPDVRAASAGVEVSPDIVSGSLQEPDIVGAVAPSTPPVEAPSIVGGDDLTPDIDSAGEE